MKGILSKASSTSRPKEAGGSKGDSKPAGEIKLRCAGKVSLETAIEKTKTWITHKNQAQPQDCLTERKDQLKLTSIIRTTKEKGL